MSLEKSEVAAVVEHCTPVNDLVRGGLQAVHESFKVLDLEQFQIGRNRARGVLKTPSFEDFKSYVLGHSEFDLLDLKEKMSAPVFVDHKSVSAIAILNFNQAGHIQGHCDHTATLKLEPTVVWEKLNQLKDSKLDQKRFATFLEDWASVLQAVDADDNAISIKEAIIAVRNMKVDATTTNEAEVENTREVRTGYTEIAAKAKKGQLPAKFKILDTAYVDLDEKEIELRLIVNGGSGEPVFAIQIVKEELLRNEIIQEFKEKVIELLPDNPVRIGTFTA